MNNLFNSVSIRKPKKNLFDLSHEKKLSCNMGELIPVYLQEVVPGDKFKVKSELLLRMAPMIAPMMHRVNVYVHYFYVPYRLLWDNWQKFITGGEDGLQTPTFPTITINEAAKAAAYKGTLSDYLGIPQTSSAETVANPLVVSALPYRAYACIFSEYYREQNLQTVVPYTKNDTVDATEWASIQALRKRGWEKDYFTSCLPWTQRGADVVLPGTPDYKSPAIVWDSISNTAAGNGALTTSGGTGAITDPADGNAAQIQNLDGYDITVNNLRRSIKLQEWLEKNARAGSRYIEQILSHFGVMSSDARLQRPEYLGGGKQPVVISEVLNTSDTATRPQGSMAGHGISVGSTNEFKKYFEEHGIVMGIMSVLPRTAYQQGVPREFRKFDKLDFYWPEFANLGEQAVINNELYHQYASGGSNTGTFGYQSRYAEYKFARSSVHGDFKDTLAFWHMGRFFSSQPALNVNFILSDPTHRIFAVTDPAVHKVYVQVYNDVKAIRPMPVFGSPLL